MNQTPTKKISIRRRERKNREISGGGVRPRPPLATGAGGRTRSTRLIHPWAQPAGAPFSFLARARARQAGSRPAASPAQANSGQEEVWTLEAVIPSEARPFRWYKHGRRTLEQNRASGWDGLASPSRRYNRRRNDCRSELSLAFTNKREPIYSNTEHQSRLNPTRTSGTPEHDHSCSSAQSYAQPDYHGFCSSPRRISHAAYCHFAARAQAAANPPAQQDARLALFTARCTTSKFFLL
ncbi:hypothetical protein PVAP13_9KG645450 [Panicum virgatum]|uniref:Uncharacterized protein n=1 Tax=Panicum virgatum TaxID=38727 RepID=A0A8T0P658_PANVG|nr:hypothetical protein PVAP13_9KG645450 [Panicum virgatum]